MQERPRADRASHIAGAQGGSGWVRARGARAALRLGAALQLRRRQGWRPGARSRSPAPPHLCPVGGRVRGKSCPRSSGASSRNLSGPIRMPSRVVTAEAVPRQHAGPRPARVPAAVWTGLHVPANPRRPPKLLSMLGRPPRPLAAPVCPWCGDPGRTCAHGPRSLPACHLWCRCSALAAPLSPLSPRPIFLLGSGVTDSQTPLDRLSPGPLPPLLPQTGWLPLPQTCWAGLDSWGVAQRRPPAPLRVSAHPSCPLLPSGSLTSSSPAPDCLSLLPAPSFTRYQAPGGLPRTPGFPRCHFLRGPQYSLTAGSGRGSPTVCPQIPRSLCTSPPQSPSPHLSTGGIVPTSASQTSTCSPMTLQGTWRRVSR